MADYSTIKGFTVQSLASDPYASAVLGATWSSGGALGTALYTQGAGGGTLTAAITMGGRTTPGPAANSTNKTQTYDGSSWTEVNALNTARFQGGGCGNQTAAVLAGGVYEASPDDYGGTENYDGTSWTAGNDLSRGTNRGLAAAGIQTAAFIAGGQPVNALMETYDGTSWSEQNNLNTARAQNGEAGTTTAGLCFGGIGPGPSLTAGVDVTETWDGTSWSNSNDMNTNRREIGMSGTQTAALGFGGIGPPSNATHGVTESFDGTSWTEVGDLATARYGPGGARRGTSGDTICFGGMISPAPTYTKTTEIWADPVYTIKTVTVS